VAKASDTTLSVVVPVYRCDECLHALHARLVPALESITADYEILYVDDRSPDGAWHTLRALAAEDPHVRAIRLSRNFGQQAAITAGLAHTTGRFAVVMDCDLQDPPELIPELYAKAVEGYDIVLARRAKRRHSLGRRLAARVYQRFLKMFIGVEISADYGAFSIISERTRHAFLEIQDSDRHYIPILHWLGFERTDIEFEHAERHAGESAYTFRDLIRLATQGVFFQTTTLLRWIVYIGFMMACVGVALAVYFVISYFFFAPGIPPGWTSLVVLLLLIGGFIIISTGVTGLYIGKIFSQVKGRPLFIVEEEVGAFAAEVDRVELGDDRLERLA
jgi:polyisoprenyl-phosphate glycosyltransferase